MNTLVTGATGFIGSHIVDALIARGDSVRALVRPGGQASRLIQQGVELVQGDLSDPQTLDTAVEGIELVYHAAALLGRERSSAAIFQTNVTGTENLLAACIRRDVRRFVFISSVAVYAPTALPLIDEESPQGAPDVYGQSKSAAEERVRHYAQMHGLSYSILRPCIVYGERDTQYTAQLLRTMRRPILIVGIGGWPYYNLVHAADVAAAAVLAGTCSQAAGQAFNITDGRGAFRQEIAQAVRRITKSKQVILTVPTRLIKNAYALRATIQAYRTGDVKSNPSIQLTRLFSHLQYDISKAQSQLGYVPQIDLREGLRRTLNV